jgi:hypothetical protein
LENLPDLEARAQEFNSAASVGGGAAPNPRASLVAPVAEADAVTLRGDIELLHVGVPILGYHVQAARDREFQQPVFDRKYEADARFSPADAALPPGAYWWRGAIVDLLGTEQSFGEPRYYSVGVKRQPQAESVDLGRSLRILTPQEGARISGDSVDVTGHVRDEGLRVEINGRAARIDEDGNFAMKVNLPGEESEIAVVVTDRRGNRTQISRRVLRR